MRPPTISLPGSADILVLTSPAFDARRPRILHKELIPPAVLDTMEWAWNTPRFPERAVRVVRLSDVWVAKEGLVFDRDGHLYRETVTQHSDAEVEQAHAAVLAAIGQGAAWGGPDTGGPVLLCKKRGIGNYGHWMMEMLPKAWLVERHLPGLGVRFLVADVPGQLRETMAFSLGMLGIDLARTLVADDAPRHFAELVVVDGLTEHGCYMSPLAVDCIDALAASDLVGRAAPPDQPATGQPATDRLFVTRRAMGFRRVVDEDALLLHARTRGFAEVEPGALRLPDQIARFRGAARIVGVMGAAMTNIVFAPPGARVVMLTPAGMPDTFFWFLSALRGLDYTEIRCAPSGPVRGNMLWDTDLVLPPDRWDALFAD